MFNNKNYAIMEKMKTLRTFKVQEKNNKYTIKLVKICNKYCTYVTNNGYCKLWHISDTHENEITYYNHVIAANIGYDKTN